MKNIAVIFGGRSVEHDISILTGLHAAKNVEGYRVHYVYITRNNQMLTGDGLGDIDCYINNKIKGKPCSFRDGFLYINRRAVKVEAVLNCCHGGIGENGELAAYFAVAGTPVTSCDYVSAVNMQSKTRTREILTKAGLTQPKYVNLTENTAVQIPFPVIVKPDTLGSSIGIQVARNENQLQEALTVAFSLEPQGQHKKVIVEEYLTNIREINCSALRINGEIKVSECEEINNKNEFFDFGEKYLNPESGFIKKGKKIKTEPKTKKLYTEIQKLTEKAYKLFNARGVIRADFIVADKKIYLNEINTVPGFLSYHLWARSGMPYGVLIDSLIKQAKTDAKTTQCTDFKSDILNKNRGLLR